MQIGGPTAAFVVIIYGIVAQYGTDGLVVATILAGIILVIMGLCRFGSLIKYIPYTITTGFTCGIAVTLFVGQLKDFFGLEMGAVPSEFVQKIIAYANLNTVLKLPFACVKRDRSLLQEYYFSRPVCEEELLRQIVD